MTRPTPPPVHAAEIVTCAVRNPFEVVKQQMQAGLHTSTGAAVRTILRAEGVRGFFAGYLSLVAREIPFDALEFVLYEQFKIRWRRRAGRELSLWDNMLLGSVAGGITAALTTPLDVAKTRLMTQAGVAPQDRYRGMVDAFRRIVREEGARVLFSGAKQRVLWISLGGAIFFGTFEEAKRRLSRVTE